MDEYLQKKKELEEAEKKALEIKKTLRAEKKEELKEKFDKYNFLHKLKPWTRTDLLLVIFMIVLFLIAYNHGGGVESGNSEEGFFSGIFGFFVKDKNVSEDNVEVTGDIVNDTMDNSEENLGDDTLDITVTTSDEGGEETVINFDIWVETTNGEEFTIIETSSDDIIYYVVIKNKESFDIQCESTDSNVGVKSYDERKIWNRVVAPEVSDKVTEEHKFTCYNVDDSIDEGFMKSITVTVNFNE